MWKGGVVGQYCWWRGAGAAQACLRPAPPRPARSTHATRESAAERYDRARRCFPAARAMCNVFIAVEICQPASGRDIPNHE